MRYASWLNFLWLPPPALMVVVAAQKQTQEMNEGI